MTGLTKEHLFQLHSVTNPILSPNEEEALFLRTIMNAQENAYDTHLFHLAVASGAVTQWTFGNESIASPQWSPDGIRITFLKKVHDVQQVFMMNRLGGEAQQVTELEAGVTSYVWHRCSTKLWLTAPVVDGQAFGEKAEDNPFPQPYVVENLKYKQEGLSGHGLRKQGEHMQIAFYTIATKELDVYTTVAVNHTLHAVSHQGDQLLVTVNYAENDEHKFNTELVLVDVATKKQQPFLQEEGVYQNAQFSYDDRYIAFSGHNEAYKNATQPALYVYDRDTNWTTNLTAALDLYVGDSAIADIQQHVQTSVIAWTETNDLYCQISTMGDVRLYYVTLDGAVYPASPEDEHVYSYAIFKSGNRALATISNPTFPGELFDVDISMGERKQLTHFHEDFLQAVTLSTPTQVSFERAGHMVYGWLLKPTEFTAGENYPLIVEIHGGPHAMYANTFFHELQLLAAQGYGVLYINPRGSHGYSQAFVDAVRGDYGGGDCEDILAAVDEVLATEPWIDRERLGVTGGSYGGFLTNWLVAHTDRFKAAVTLRSISNWVSFYGVSDIGYYFTEWQLATDRDVDTLWKHSPLNYVDTITTPLLIMHSEEDFRCPIEQAEQLYTAMKRLEKEVAFVRFPASNHNLSRAGKPNLRQERLGYMLDWFSRYL